MKNFLNSIRLALFGDGRTNPTEVELAEMHMRAVRAFYGIAPEHQCKVIDSGGTGTSPPWPPPFDKPKISPIDWNASLGDFERRLLSDCGLAGDPDTLGLGELP